METEFVTAKEYIEMSSWAGDLEFLPKPIFFWQNNLFVLRHNFFCFAYVYFIIVVKIK